MTHRATFALDKVTARRLKRLAARWQVSQAEVVRRSVEQAEQSAAPEKPDPVAMLRRLHESGGGIDPKRAEKWLAEIREDRKRWRGQCGPVTEDQKTTVRAFLTEIRRERSATSPGAPLSLPTIPDQ